MRHSYSTLVGKPKGKSNSEVLDVDGQQTDIRINVTEIWQKMWTGYIWVRIRTSGGLL
jgi:hypothetical protein